MKEWIKKVDKQKKAKKEQTKRGMGRDMEKRRGKEGRGIKKGREEDEGEEEGSRKRSVK